MASGRYKKICDISRLDPVFLRTSRYEAKDANLKFIHYTENFPGDKQLYLHFINVTARDDFLKLFTKRILLSKIQLESLIKLNMATISPGIDSTTNNPDHLTLILAIACDYAQVEYSLKGEICQLPYLILPPIIEELCKLADANFAEAKKIISVYNGMRNYQDTQKRDFIDSLMYQLGFHFESNPETYDKAIECYDSIEKDNNYFARAQLHRERCYKLFMETDLQNPLLKEMTLLKKEIAALNERVTTLEKTSFVPQKDERKQSSGHTITVFKKQQ